jgi:hypothetical protein
MSKITRKFERLDDRLHLITKKGLLLACFVLGGLFAHVVIAAIAMAVSFVVPAAHAAVPNAPLGAYTQPATPKQLKLPETKITDPQGVTTIKREVSNTGWLYTEQAITEDHSVVAHTCHASIRFQSGEALHFSVLARMPDAQIINVAFAMSSPKWRLEPGRKLSVRLQFAEHAVLWTGEVSVESPKTRPMVISMFRGEQAAMDVLNMFASTERVFIHMDGSAIGNFPLPTAPDVMEKIGRCLK